MARSADVGRTVLVTQVTDNDRRSTVLLWRTRYGKAVAMDVRCPHRDYPMNQGRLVDDALECPLHGYRFGPTGRCLNVRWAKPARVLEVREADGYVWLRR